MTNQDEEIRRLAYWLLKDVNRAVNDFEMIGGGDRIAVAVSGGKDSLCLLRLLDWRRKSVPEDYELVAIHVSGDSRGPRISPHQPLLAWLEGNDYEYAVEPIYLPEGEQLPMDCHRCTWNRRRTIFEAAHRLDCNVVALGHHGDDLAETTLINLLYHGKVETMAPVADYFDGTFQLIRPMCYLAEKDIKRFAALGDFPAPTPTCPQHDQSKRALMAELLQKAIGNCQDARINLLRAGLRGTMKGET